MAVPADSLAYVAEGGTVTIDRSLWIAPFRADAPLWPCPSCDGSLKVVANSMKFGEDVESKRAAANENWDPEWIEERFSSMLQCMRGSCGQYVALVGTVRYEMDQEGDSPSTIGYRRILTPIVAIPMSPLFKLPAKCPKPIAEELTKSFSLIWLDVASAANRVRAAIELLMDHLGVKKQMTTTKGERRRLPLHDRIVLFKVRQPTLADSLLAVKWIGNSGSHPSGVTIDDLLDAYDILEDALGELIGKRTKTLRRLVSNINRGKGPLSKRGR